MRRLNRPVWAFPFCHPLAGDLEKMSQAEIYKTNIADTVKYFENLSSFHLKHKGNLNFPKYVNCCVKMPISFIDKIIYSKDSDIMSISAISGISTYTATSSTNSQSEISKLRAQEKQLQQQLTELQTDSSGKDSDQIQEQETLIQQQISQIQQQIQQLQDEADKKAQESQMTQAAQANNKIGDASRSLKDHLLDITV